MRTAALAMFFWLFTFGAAQSQSSSPVIVPGAEVWDHVIQPQHTWVHFPTDGRWMPLPLRLTLTVSPQGNVVGAEFHGNPEQMQAWSAAQAIVYGWKYRPFLQDGQSVTALVQSGISIVPPEIPPNSVPEPNLRPDS